MKTGADRHVVFVYGILKTPRWFRAPPERVRGVMYERDGYAACVFGPDAVGFVRGELRQVNDETLAHWDRIEGVDAGWYERVRVVTESGVEAWAYELGPSPRGLPVLETGLWIGRER